MKRRVFILITFIIMAFCFGVQTFAAENPVSIKLSVDKTEAEVGDTITITIYSDTEVSGIQGWGMDLYINSKAFKLKESAIYGENNELLGLVTDNTEKHSSVNISAFDTTGGRLSLTIPKGVLATLTFEVVGEAEGSFQLKEVGANPPDSVEQLLRETSNTVKVAVKKAETAEPDSKENLGTSEETSSNNTGYGNGNNGNTVNDNKTVSGSTEISEQEENAVPDENFEQEKDIDFEEDVSEDETPKNEKVEIIKNNSVDEKISTEAILLLCGAALLLVTALVVFLKIKKKV